MNTKTTTLLTALIAVLLLSLGLGSGIAGPGTDAWEDANGNIYTYPGNPQWAFDDATTRDYEFTDPDDADAARWWPSHTPYEGGVHYDTTKWKQIRVDRFNAYPWWKDNAETGNQMWDWYGDSDHKGDHSHVDGNAAWRLGAKYHVGNTNENADGYILTGVYDIGYSNAMAILNGDPLADVTVGIICQGVETNHPDLDGSIVDGDFYTATNTLSGLSNTMHEPFYNATGRSINTRFGAEYLQPASTYWPINPLGTWAAGIIAAEDDGNGITGLATNAELYIAKFDMTATGFSNAVVGCVAEGCKVICVTEEMHTPSAAVAYALDYAKNNDVLIVAGAVPRNRVVPSSGYQPLPYPMEIGQYWWLANSDGTYTWVKHEDAIASQLMENCISVTPANQMGELYRAYCYGASFSPLYVDMGAPGEFITTTTLMSAPGASARGYVVADGPACSAAIVAGMAAVIRGWNTNLTAPAVKAALVGGALRDDYWCYDPHLDYGEDKYAPSLIEVQSIYDGESGSEWATKYGLASFPGALYAAKPFELEYDTNGNEVITWDDSVGILLAASYIQYDQAWNTYRFGYGKYEAQWKNPDWHVVMQDNGSGGSELAKSPWVVTNNPAGYGGYYTVAYQNVGGGVYPHGGGHWSTNGVGWETWNPTDDLRDWNSASPEYWATDTMLAAQSNSTYAASRPTNHFGLKFDGNDYLTTDTWGGYSNAVFLFKMGDVTGQQILFGHYNSSLNERFYFGVKNGDWSFGVANKSWPTTGVAADTDWHVGEIVYNGLMNNSYLYIDGTLVCSNYPTDGTHEGDHIALGGGYDASSGGVWYKVKDGTEIAMLFLRRTRFSTEERDEIDKMIERQLWIIDPDNYNYVPPASRVAWYNPDGMTSTGWNDADGNYDATQTESGRRPTINTDNFVDSMVFDGLNDYLNTGWIGSSTSNVTISVFCKPDDTASMTQKMVVGRGAPRSYIGSSDGTTWSGGYAGAAWLTDRDVDIMKGGWVHLVLVGTSSNLKLYVNGTLSDSRTCSFSGAFDDALCIGSYSGGGYYFPGEIVDVRIYEDALSTTELQDLYLHIMRSYVDEPATTP